MSSPGLDARLGALTCLTLLVSSTPRERLIELARMIAVIVTVDRNAENQDVEA